MRLPTDYADRSSLLADLTELEDHWHKDSNDTKLGKLAALAGIVAFGLALSFVYSKSAPALGVNTVSCYSLVDSVGEE